MPLISAAMIVRDEEAHLVECLRSITPFVDEIIVVDTGSIDRTKSIAQRFDVKLFDFPWCDDFAAARNAALAQANGQWILYIDADERVRPTSVSAFRALLKTPALVGCFVRLHAHSHYTSYREMRLFRNNPDIRFEGVIHENIWPGIRSFIDRHGGELGTSDLILDHVGYHGDQDHKHRRNLPLLQRRLAQDPDHVYSWWHLGSVHLGLDDKDAAREAWWSAIAAVRRAKHRPWEQSLPYIEMIELDFADHHVIDPLLDEALSFFPDNAHLIWVRAQKYLREKDWQRALQDFESLAAWPQAQSNMVQIGYDERLFDLHAFAGIAACQFQLGNFQEARKFYRLAHDVAPDPEFHIKQLLCSSLLNA